MHLFLVHLWRGASRDRMWGIDLHMDLDVARKHVRIRFVLGPRKTRFEAPHRRIAGRSRTAAEPAETASVRAQITTPFRHFARGCSTCPREREPLKAWQA